MYIPSNFQIIDQAELLAFMRRYSFATIITVKDNFPTATHLPFLLEERENGIVLISHFAKKNDQWRELTDHLALVIFSEPHAYISPKHYDKELNVPTWNYVSVHVYGHGKVVDDHEKVFAVLEKTIVNFESDYLPQWKKLPLDYKQHMANGIVAFEIQVTDIQGKKKLSQNRSEAEQQRIVSSFSNSPDQNERIIADFMNQNKVS